MAEYQPPRGMKDIVPSEMERRKWIYTNIRTVLDSYGYSEVAPTELEMWDTLAAKAGEDNLNEVYDFKDKGDRRLALRFDLTCGIARMVAGMRIPRPIKLYAIGNAWRYDAPQKGRYRCFTQWDVELFGTDSTAADAEIINLSSDILKSLGLDFEVRINNRKLVENIFNYLKIDKKCYVDVMRTVDKIPKLSEYDILTEFKNAGITKSQATSLLDILGRKGNPKDLIPLLRKEFKDDRQVQESIDTLENLFTNLGKECILDLSIVRGIGYYTGIVFEAFDPKEEKLGSLFAGGRFDGLVGVYGKEDMPAVGVGGGMERLLEILEQKNAFEKMKRPKSVFIAPINDSVRPYAKKVAATFRKKGFMAELDLTGRNLKKQFDYANKKGFDYVGVIGDKEKEEKCFMLRDMVTGREKKIKM
ncbi:MAG: histidine--tRNA ligase [Nanohaloarchaea archaeon]|nr:histidine--tRNA ligase [Candidatus Nanohaloarchaea archaeon]